MSFGGGHDEVCGHKKCVFIFLYVEFTCRDVRHFGPRPSKDLQCKESVFFYEEIHVLESEGGAPLSTAIPLFKETLRHAFLISDVYVILSKIVDITHL
jgi:hypothetical protein